jgi:putative DeoR family transcriptional regulator (stage III sporulation protein D)
VKEYISERVRRIAAYIIESNCTVRAAAAKFGVSKSTVHKDITERLIEIDKQLHEEVSRVLLENKRERHLRGGAATREKYKRTNGAS